MKKILTIFLIGGSMIVLIGCAQKYTADVTFDQFTFKATTEIAPVQEINETQKEIFKNEENIYKIYTIMNGSGFSDSLIIYKQQSSTNIPLDRLMQLNMKELTNRLKGFKAGSQVQVDIKCGNNMLTGYFESTSFDSVTPNKTVYMNQYFFKAQDNIYIISSSTENSANSNGYKAGLKNIQCK